LLRALPASFAAGGLLLPDHFASASCARM